MIEERTIGGTCVNRGCLPSKNLIEAAKPIHDARHPRRVNMVDDLLKVGEIATQAGIGVQSVHYYERLGLLPKAQRSPANHRLYPVSALHRVQFIKKAQAVGFTLEEIKEILDSQRGGQKRCERVIELGTKRLKEIKAELEFLDSFRKSLATALARWRKQTSGHHRCGGEFCDLIESLPGVSNQSRKGKMSRPKTRVE